MAATHRKEAGPSHLKQARGAPREARVARAFGVLVSSLSRLALALSLALSPAAAVFAQDAPPPAAQPTADQAFAAIEAAIGEIQSSPPANRQRLIAELHAQVGQFLDRHLQAASAEQATKAGGIWLQLAPRLEVPEEAVRARIAQLRALDPIPQELAGVLDQTEAKLNLKVGATAPNWTATDVMDGAQASLEDLRGKLVLMDFWATWCPPCKTLMQRELQPLHQKYGQDERFMLVGVGLPWNGETAAKEKAFAEQQGYHWRKVFDASGAAGQAYGVEGIPFLALVDEEGKILVMGSGWSKIEEVKRVLAERLGQGGAADAAPAGE